jgi:hemoglobin-like flavoprotein
MTAREVTLVQESFRKVLPNTEQVAAIFYARLFEIEPAVRGLFNGDMQEQGKKLFQMLALAVGSLECFESVSPFLRQLGARHTSYGVRDEHYSSVGVALLWTLERGLGSAFTPEVKHAWTALYAAIANTMLEGAHAKVAA